MTNGEVYGHCAKKPGAYEDRPFGDVPICFKVCGKLFLQLYPHPENHKITVSCDADLADFYRAQFSGDVVPGYHCPGRLRPYMNTVLLNRGVPDPLIFTMIDHSYDRVVSKLTRRERERLYK